MYGSVSVVIFVRLLSPFFRKQMRRKTNVGYREVNICHCLVNLAKYFSYSITN